MGDQHTETPQQERSEAVGAPKSAPRAGGAPSSAFLPPRLNVAGAADGPPLTRDNLMFLQRAVGNRAVAGLLQRKGKLDQPDTAGGRAADSEDERVRRPGDGGLVQAQEQPGETPAVSREEASRIESMRGGGEPLPESSREYFEPRFGQDFSQVRLHHDARAADSARAVNARAYTTGRDIVFAAGEYRPEGPEGKRLLAHELTHVVQQSGGQPHQAQAKGAGQSAFSVGPVDDAAERDAEATAERVASGGSAAQAGFVSASPSAVQRQPDAQEDRLPEPFEVMWGGDRLRVAFRREDRGVGDSRLHVEVMYLGGRATFGDEVVRMSVDIAPRKLRAEMREGAAGEVVLDLYGDREYVLRLQDSVEHDPKSVSFGRGHHLRLILNGEFRSSSMLSVLDPASTPADARPFTPGFLPGTVPVFDGMMNPATHKLELKALVDGDGDQHPELEVTIEADSFMSWASQMRREEPVRVLLRQAHDPAGARRHHTFSVTAPAGSSAAPARDPGVGQGVAPPNSVKLAANVRSLTDGRAPTVIDLTDPPSTQQLFIHPPTTTPSGISYLLEKNGSGVRYEFPPEQTPLRPAVAATQGRVLGRIAFWDVTLGPYNDRFRLMIDKGSSGSVIAGLAPLGYEVGYIRAAAVPITFAGQLGSIRLLQGGPVSVALDFNGDNAADLTLHDRMQSPEGVSPEAERTHTIRLSGPAVGADRLLTFVARAGGWIRRPDGTVFSADDQRMMAATGATQGLAESEQAGTFERRRYAFEAAFNPYRQRALDSHWITQQTFDAWKVAEADIIMLEAQAPTGQVQPALGASAATHVRALYDALNVQTASETQSSFTRYTSTRRNPYTDETSTTVYGLGTSTKLGAGALAADDFRAGRWSAGLVKYRELRAGLDRWIVEQAKRAGVSGRELAQMRASSAMLRELDKLAGKNAKRIHAVFRPDPKFRGEAGYMEQVPLELYYWREGDEWHLLDLTNPERPYRDSVSAAANDFETARRLMGQLDDEDHFCEGRIYFEVPGIASGQLTVEDRVTWKDFFTWLGIGLAVVGTVLSFGTGAVAVAGTWALAGSALAGGTAAAINLVESSRHGTATTTSVLLDLTQIVTSITGVGALAAGRVLSSARTAAGQGAALTGSRWATISAMAQRYAVPLAATNLAGDAVTLAILSVEAATQLDAVENSPGVSDEAKRDAKLRLLAQFAFTGGLTALSLRGNVAEIRMGRSIEVIKVNGEPVVVPVGTSIAGKAVTESAGQVSAASDDAARALAEQAHLRTIRQRIEGPTGGVLANVEELALAAQAGRADAVLTADASGALTRGGAAAGTLDSLTTRVAEANNATRAHGIDVEYVLDIRSSGRAGVHEVRVTRRARTPGVGGDPRRLYVDVAARTAAEARQLGRLRAAAGSAPVRVELSPDGILRINGQLDVLPRRLSEMPDADVAALASSTHALDIEPGGMAALERSNPTAYSRLLKFSSSSDSPHASGNPTRGYRLRFAHSHAAGNKQLDNILGQLGTRRADHRAFQSPSQHDLDRLYDLTSESLPSGTSDNLKAQATRYSLDQNPRDVDEFVSHYQFYMAEVRLRIQTEINAQVKAGVAVGKGTARKIGARVEAGMVDPANPRVPSAKTATDLGAQYTRITTQIAGRVGTAHINPKLDDVGAVEAIRALPHVRFEDVPVAAYHTHKHHHELPKSKRPDGVSEFDAYSAAIHETLHNSKETVADIAATRSTSQRGGGRSYTFTLSEGGQNMRAFVFVSDEGVVSLSSLIP